MYPNLITHIKKYVPVSDEEVTLLLSHVKPVEVAKKEILLMEGQVCRHNYFVEKGCLRMYFINGKGTEQITQFALENWWIADYMSFDRQLPSPFLIQAIEHSEIYAFDHLIQQELFDKIPAFERYSRLMLHKAYAAAQLRLKFLYDLSKEENYRQFSAGFPEFIQRIPQYMLASYLGITPEYLSELRKKLK